MTQFCWHRDGSVRMFASSWISFLATAPAAGSPWVEDEISSVREQCCRLWSLPSLRLLSPWTARQCQWQVVALKEAFLPQMRYWERREGSMRTAGGQGYTQTLPSWILDHDNKSLDFCIVLWHYGLQEKCSLLMLEFLTEVDRQVFHCTCICKYLLLIFTFKEQWPPVELSRDDWHLHLDPPVHQRPLVHWNFDRGFGKVGRAQSSGTGTLDKSSKHYPGQNPPNTDHTAPKAPSRQAGNEYMQILYWIVFTRLKSFYQFQKRHQRCM